MFSDACSGDPAWRSGILFSCISSCIFFYLAAIAVVISAAAAAAMAYLYATAACLAAFSEDFFMTNVLSEPYLGYIL